MELTYRLCGELLSCDTLLKASTYLKLAVSIQTQPIFTSHGPPSTGLEEHGRVLSGDNKPLSLANCSRHIGRKSVSDTMTNTSLLKYYY